jgi:hypothetical protein
MGRRRLAYITGLLYVVVSLIIAILIFVLNERLSLLLIKAIVAAGVLLVGVAAGLSTIVSAKYEDDF